jgi:hypothetical protein
MNEIKKKMIQAAKDRYKVIYPCSSKDELGECFTTENNTVMFWFNTEDKSTHVLTANLQ